ncbi:class I SAM-dependent methyltransferase (plasmid) [Burkholderia sp. FERM BP-3421]|uniref:class I SAM-dependent methyltransferase n=1 Tax=Burkholderia sp. FERM BP-3421 TaxID=1494466 RepID=UPI00236069E9|nr:class I SAM-dependent methyltransferase [Burkholderia sp. FERM BP-3421]WDD90194.1 class I SAM-dependent methyltransferase [Burkholderia sp. FERM BP-3421]
MSHHAAFGNSTIMNHYAHGYVLMPILYSLERKGIWSLIRNRRTLSFAELVAITGAAPGYLNIALRIGEAVGLIAHDEALIRWVDQDGVAERLSGLDPALFGLYALDPIAYLTHATEARWTFAIDALERRGRGSEQDWFREFTDGIVAIPLLVGLNRLAATATATSGPVDLSDISPVAKHEVQRLFAWFHWSDGIEASSLALTDVGRWVCRNALNYSLGLSYRPLLNQIDALIFGDSRTLFARLDAFENHVDRTLNVLASGSMHKTYFRSVADTVVRLFEDERFEQQPACIVDTGCGDGSLLAELYRRIRDDSPRGRVLHTFPLTMVGVDYNPASLAATHRTLTEKAVPHRVLHGDIGDPDGLRAALREAGIDDPARPLLHVRSFLDHDRPYRAPTTPSRAPTLVPAGLHATRDGAIVAPQDVQDSLIEHLSRWRAALNERDALLVLEVHALEARLAFEARHDSISLHFDPLQALTGQLLVSAKAFVYATAAAGLHTAELVRFPKHDGMTRITFQHLLPVDYQIRFATHEDVPLLAQLGAAQLNLPPAEAALLVQQRLQRFPEGQFVVETGGAAPTIEAVAYVNRSDLAAPVRGLADAIDQPAGRALRLVDLHAVAGRLDHWHDVLSTFLARLMYVDPSYDRLIQVSPHPSTASLPGDGAHLAAGQFQTPDGARHTLLSLERHPARPGPGAAAPLTLGQARELIDQTLLTIVTVSGDDPGNATSLLDLGLDSLEITQIVHRLNQRLAKKISVSDVFRHNRLDLLAQLLVKRSGTEPAIPLAAGTRDPG